MNAMIQKLKEIAIILDEVDLAEKGADYMRSITPVRSGNARKKTYANNSLIKADYPYAKRLDEGWSKQNQIGLIEPTLEYLEKYIQSRVK